jgi:hypothetical protein
MRELLGLWHFVQAARSGGITHGAARVGVSIAAVSNSIVRLERNANDQLFVRTPRYLQLTSAGVNLLSDVESTLDTPDYEIEGHGELISPGARALVAFILQHFSGAQPDRCHCVRGRYDLIFCVPRPCQVTLRNRQHRNRNRARGGALHTLVRVWCDLVKMTCATRETGQGSITIIPRALEFLSTCSKRASI